MSKICHTLAIVFLALTFLITASFTQNPPEDSIDYDNLSPSEIHKIMAEAKAGQLDRARAFAAEAARAISIYDQTEYDVGFHRIELEIDIPSEIVYGNVLMEAKSTIEGLDSIEVDLYTNLTIDSVYIPGGGNLNYDHSDNKIFLELDRLYADGETFSFYVRYHGRPTGSGLDGFSFDYRSGYPVVTTLSEPMSARTWWPCKDRPDDKADSLDIFITCDTAYFCASNGTLIDTIRNGDGTWTFNYEERYPITTYLFSIAISNYTVWHDWYHYGDGDSMIIINHVYPDRYAYSLSQFGITPYAIGVYAGLFGEYPFINEKYGHANFQWGGAMEHQTVSSMSGSNFGFSEPVVVHELSHQWWGDMITCNNWHEIWLNEGFASYCEALYYEAKDGVDAYHDYMGGMFYSSGGTIYIYDTTNVWNIFSSIVYDKGAWVLHMLRHVVGDSTFFDILRAYYSSEWQHKDATTERLKEICETVSGMELDYFFEQWIYGMYFPRYMWSYMNEYDPADGKYWTYFYLEQGQATYPQVFVMPIDLVFTYDSHVDTVVLFNDVGKNVYIFKADEPPTDVALDPDQWIQRWSYKLNWSYHLIPFPLDTAGQYQSYLDSVVAKGGTGQHTYKITSGELPLGLELDSLTGYISGAPADFGEFTFGVFADDRGSSYDDTIELTLVVLEGEGLPGDANDDDAVNLLDITFIISYLYKNGPEPPIPAQADPNALCDINLLDITYLIDFLYREGPDPLWGCAVL